MQGPHLMPIYIITNDKQYNLVQGPQLEVQGPLIGAGALAPLFVALAPLLVALAQALAPEK